MGLDDLLPFATGLVREAGRLAAARFATGTAVSGKVSEKDDGTEANPVDREVEVVLRERILDRFPHDGVYGEEGGEQPGTSGRRWVLDPINGTSLFVRRIPTFTILLAVEDDDGPAVGVIGHPVAGDLVYAGRGLGCWWQAGDAAPQRLHVSTTGRRRGATVETLNQVSWSEELLVALHREVFVLPAMGGSTDVAAGTADALVIAGFPMGYEDRAPLPLVVGEAGGRVTDLNGDDVLAGDGSVLASNGLLHDGLLELVAGISHGRDFRGLLR
jgi:histidinol-phosphatase